MLKKITYNYMSIKYLDIENETIEEKTMTILMSDRLNAVKKEFYKQFDKTKYKYISHKLVSKEDITYEMDTYDFIAKSRIIKKTEKKVEE